MRRGKDRGNARDWLWSALLGVGLALACIIWLNGRSSSALPAAPPTAPAVDQSGERSLGFEFTLRVRILLPKGREG